MVHKMFYIGDLNFVHTDFSESDIGFLCSGLRVCYYQMIYFKIKVGTFISNLILSPSVSILSWILYFAFLHGASILKSPR